MGLAGEIVREPPGPHLREINSDFAHGLDNFRVNPFRRISAG
jgi:hypothetical protein